MVNLVFYYHNGELRLSFTDSLLNLPMDNCLSLIRIVENHDGSHIIIIRYRGGKCFDFRLKNTGELIRWTYYRSVDFKNNKGEILNLKNIEEAISRRFLSLFTNIHELEEQQVTGELKDIYDRIYELFDSDQEYADSLFSTGVKSAKN
jgi:hypothetical protein